MEAGIGISSAIRRGKSPIIPNASGAAATASKAGGSRRRSAPGFAKPDEPLPFPFLRQRAAAGIVTEFCPCGGGVGTHTGPIKGNRPLVGEEKHGYRRNFPDEGKWSVVHVALTTWPASRSASRRPQKIRAEAHAHFTLLSRLEECI